MTRGSNLTVTPLGIAKTVIISGVTVTSVTVTGEPCMASTKFCFHPVSVNYVFTLFPSDLKYVL